MMRGRPHPLAFCLALLASMVAAFQPVAAQSILRDAETEELLKDMTAPLVEASELEPGNVELVLINNGSINAFVAGGQAIYVHSGLIGAADSVNEFQGVIAHELGHITGGHVINEDGARQATGISILSLVLGGLAAAAGSGDAAIGVLMAGQQAALGKFLAFSRVQESTADAAGSSNTVRPFSSSGSSLIALRTSFHAFSEISSAPPSPSASSAV